MNLKPGTIKKPEALAVIEAAIALRRQIEMGARAGLPINPRSLDSLCGALDALALTAVD
jgi:hypothetical protein